MKKSRLAKTAHQLVIGSSAILLMLAIDSLSSPFGLKTIAYRTLEAPLLNTLAYSGGETVYSGYYTCGGEQRLIPKIGYILTADDVNTVKAYYETMFPKFGQNWDEGGVWWETYFTSQPNIFEQFISRIADLLDSLTNEQISLSLIDLTQKTKPFTPQFMMLCNSLRYFYANPPIAQLEDFKTASYSKGTLIIYRYYVYVPFVTIN